MSTTVTSKGQVTIPKPIRERLRIEAGSKVDFRLDPAGQVVLLKADSRPARARFAALRDRAGPGLSTDEIMALTRGDDE